MAHPPTEIFHKILDYLIDHDQPDGLHNSIHSLRLVSHQWNRGTAPLLAKHTTWKVKLDSEVCLQRALACVTSPSGQTSAHERSIPTNEMVRRLEIDPGRGFHASCSEISCKKEKLQHLFLELLGRLHRVECFIISYPWESEDEPEMVDETIDVVREGFFQTSVLKYISDVRLKIPSTYHTGEILSAIAKERPAQIRNLLVEITDYSGVSGSREYLEESLWEDEDIDGTAEESDSDDTPRTPGDDQGRVWQEKQFPRSLIQRAYPNRRHQQALWDFISSCTNLETLKIQGTHFLDLNRIIWQNPGGFLGLRELHLERVYAKISSIRQLLQPSDQISSSQLQRIYLDDVKIPRHGGRWGELATYLSTNCPDLNASFFYNLSYFQDCGQGAGLSSPAEDTIIDSSSDCDLLPILTLMDKMRQKYGDDGDEGLG